MSFLAPAFLIGTLAVVVPILVHLTHRRTGKVVPFPSLMFLEQVPFRSMRRQQIRHWFLLLLRAGALVLLALAFARPFIEQPTIAASLTAEARELAILVDTSYSMGYGDRWERARDAARELIQSLQPSDRASLIFFAEGARLSVRATAEPSALLGALEAARLTSETTRYAPALRLAQQALSETALPAREAILITDLQRIGWSPEEDVRLPPGATLTIVDVAEDTTSANLAVAGLLIQRQFADDAERLSLAARLTLQGEEAKRGVEVVLEIDGSPVQTRTVDLPGNGATTVQFEPVTVSDRRLRGVVRAGTDELAVDNSFHLAFEPGDSLGVLILEPVNSVATDSLYLREALAISDRPAFVPRVKPARDLVSGDLTGVAVVVLNDAAVSANGAGLLREFVAAGGGLIVALGEMTSASDWDTPAARELIPSFGDPVNRSAEFGGTLASFDAEHPIFEVFRAPRSGDFTAAHFYRYRPLEISEAEIDRALARFDDGRIALTERSLGDGRVLVWTSTLDRFWNDLPTRPVFLPFAHELVKHAAGFRESRDWYLVAEPIDLTGVDEAGLPAGTEIVWRKVGGTSGSHVVGDTATALTLSEQGFYELSWTEDTNESDLVIAVNVDRAESDLTRLDPEELVAAATTLAATDTAGIVAGVTADDREQRQSFWWYVLVAAFLLLIAETTVSNRLEPLAR